jgi:hypothetical protein
MRFMWKAQSLWALVAYGALGVSLASTLSAHAARQTSVPDLSGNASRMAFKEGKKNKKETSCQLTLMHVYTSKYNKKFTQFAFTGWVVAKREVGKPMVLSVIGQNHQLAPGGKGVQPFPIPRIELGVEDVSVRRFTGHKSSCKKSSVCAEYKDSKKNELQTWLGDDAKNLHLLFPLVTKQPAVVIDLSKFAAGQSGQTPLAQFKRCTAALR